MKKFILIVLILLFPFIARADEAMEFPSGTPLEVFTPDSLPTGIVFPDSDVSPDETGELVYDNTVTGLIDGLLAWYDDDEIRYLVDLATLPTNDDYVVAYDAVNDLFYMKQDADSGGATAWDDIGNPDAADEIDFGAYVTELNIEDFRIGDGASAYVGFNGNGAMTIHNTAVPGISISMTNITGIANRAIDIIGGEALGASESFTGIRIKPSDISPTAGDTRIRGLAVNLSEVSTAQGFDSIDGIRIFMPTYYTDMHAIHITEGQIFHAATMGSDAGALYAAYTSILDASSLHANSEVHAFDVATSGGVPSGAVAALGTHAYVAPIHQHIGTYSTPDQNTFAGKYVTNDWIDGNHGGTPENLDAHEVFKTNADWIAVGSAAVFSEIEVIITTAGTKTVSPTFWYSTGQSTWTQFYPEDDTDGFQQSGLIHWSLGDISGTWTGDGEPSIGEVTAGYWIKILRTAAPDPGTPTPTTIKTGTVTLYSWDKTGAVDLLSMEADTLTEGGNAVWNNTETDIIKDTHIDWGTGASQVSAVDLPIADSGSIITATEVEGALQENRTAIDLNTSKVTESTTVTSPLVLTTYDVSIPAATNAAAGHASAAHIQAIEANTAKDTNVSTTLEAGTVNATTYGITSDGGANDIVLPEADTTNAGLLGADKWDEIVANSLKVTNATHTGEVTGATTLTVDPTTISNKVDTTIADADFVLFWDVTDSTLKKVDAAELTAGGSAEKILYIKVIAYDDTLSTGNAQAKITISDDINGMNLVDADAAVYTVSSSGTPTIQIHNLTDTSDMLSTTITIDINELNSYTAATQPVINAAEDDVVTGDVLQIDVDVEGTGTKGLDIILSFETP